MSYLTANKVNDVEFQLDSTFLEKFEGSQPDWGPIGYVTYKRTYARRLDEGGTEEFWQTLKRVVEGTFTVQKRWCLFNNLPWKERKAQKSAQKMYEKMWKFHFLPPGRGLWGMGTYYMFRKGGACLNNCAFISTKDIDQDFSRPFTFLMDMSMVGVGCGSDCRGAGKVTIQEPEVLSGSTYRVHDSREGWVDIVERVLESFVGEAHMPEEIDYSNIRDEGEPIEGFGGVSSGPEPLKELVNELKDLLYDRVGEEIRSADIVDIHNLIGKCVVAGGIRRTAEIMFGEPTDEEFLDLKDPEKHPEKLQNHRWASNNSVFAKVGMDYSEVAKRTANNGEPGFEWLQNARDYSRMKNGPDNKDHKAMGGNPCQPSFAILHKKREGRVPFSEVEVGDEIWSKEGWTRVVDKWCSGEKDVYRYETESAQFVGTEDHEVISDGEKVKVSETDSFDCLGDGAAGLKESIDFTLDTETEEIQNVQYLGKFEVFDIEVDNESHTYWTDGVDVSNCLEQTLHHGEVCNLVETFPVKHESLDEWQNTLKYAYMYAKTVSLVPIHDSETNAIVNKNRRIGCSMSGIVQAFDKFGRRQLIEAADEGYDKIQHWDKTYSDWLGVPKSIKTTSIKPSGTTSRLPGVTSGIHYPISQYYIRNVRFQSSSDVLDDLRDAGFPVEEAKQSDNTYVVSFPVKKDHIRRSVDEVSMWEQLENVSQFQKYWADNQISATINFDPETEADDIKYALELYEDQLKGVSFLPKEDHGYEQAPYIPISEEEYYDMVQKIDTFELDGETHEVEDKFCSGEFCEVDL